MNLIIAGIHTGIGKTLCSAVLAEALAWDYWKPVQAGDLEASDSWFVRSHISNTTTVIHPERYQLQRAASPHWAAAEEGITMQLQDFVGPITGNSLLIETAGGVMSPLSERLVNLDLMRHLNCPVVLVCQDYLGSINHSLLSIQALRSAGIELCGLVFSGKEVATTRQYIVQYSGVPVLLSIPYFDKVSKETIGVFARSVSSQLKKKVNAVYSKR
jgi:dethiobiotin synthetase